MRLSNVPANTLHTEDCAGNVTLDVTESSLRSSGTFLTLNVFLRTSGPILARLVLPPERPVLEVLYPVETLPVEVAPREVDLLEVLAAVRVDYHCRDPRPRAESPTTLALLSEVQSPSRLLLFEAPSALRSARG